MLSASKSQQVRSEIETRAYSFVSGEFFHINEELSQEQIKLWDSWANLKADRFIQGEYQFRFRRYGRFLLLSNKHLAPLPHVPFYQSKENNWYAGGTEREFDPLASPTLNNRFLAELIRCDFDLLPISNVQRLKPWEIDIHQYRVVSENVHAGQSTPEGIHHDGFDFFVTHLVKRTNISGGISQIYTNEQQLMDSLMLSAPMDSLIVNDTRVMHAVTSILARDPLAQAYRDILVINFLSNPRNIRSPGDFNQNMLGLNTANTLAGTLP